MLEHGANKEMRVAITRADLIEELGFDLCFSLVRCGTLVDAIPIQRTEFPVFNHHSVFAITTRVFAAEAIMEFPWYLSGWFERGSAVFPESLLLHCLQEFWFPVVQVF